MADIVEINQNQISVGYNKEQVELVKNTVAKGATDDELKMFLYLANQYNLDPFKNEIWFMKYGDKTNIMTSRDGYLKYAQMNYEFEGLMSFVVREGDVFEIDAADYKITHKFGAKRGHILGAWARCDRRGKKPFIAYVEFSEYNKRNNIWNGYPSAMIQKVAEVFVLKRAFGINGLITKEEIDAGETDGIAKINPLAADRAQLAYMYNLAKEKNIDGEEIKEYMKLTFGKEISTELTKEEANKVINMLKEIGDDTESDDTVDAYFEEIDDVEDDTDLPWETSDLDLDDEDIPY